MRLLTLLILTITFISCKETPTLGDVNLSAFKSDRGACNGTRSNEIDALEAAKKELLGKTENEIFDMLGRYDVQVLDRRQTKLFIYYLKKGDHCIDGRKDNAVPTMILRFNAVALVREVTFQMGLPD